jgi:hypothetical protein
MAGDTTSLHLRLPKRLYKRLQRQAKRNNVSLNTEIVNQLEGRELGTVIPLTETVKEALRSDLPNTFVAFRVSPKTGRILEQAAFKLAPKTPVPPGSEPEKK